MKVFYLVVLVSLLSGCAFQRPLKPGLATIRTGGLLGLQADLKQPENPAQPSAQNIERITETELPLTAGTRILEQTMTPDGSRVHREIVLAEPTSQKTRVVEKAGSVLGAAQKDTAREIGAKLASMKGIVWVGLFLFMAGAASLAWPWLRAIVGSVTTSVAMLAGGLTLMFLPTVIVGNELVILGGVLLAIGAWFTAHRHGRLRGLVDANKNGIDDRTESQATRTRAT